MYLFDKTLFRQMNKNCYYLQHKQPPFSASQGAYTCIASRHKGPYTLINIIKKTPSLASFFVFFFLTLSLSFFFSFLFNEATSIFLDGAASGMRGVCVLAVSLFGHADIAYGVMLISRCSHSKANLPSLQNIYPPLLIWIRKERV